MCYIVYREELMKLVNEFDQNRKFKKEMATIEELLILITQDKTQLELQIKS